LGKYKGEDCKLLALRNTVKYFSGISPWEAVKEIIIGCWSFRAEVFAVKTDP